MVERERNAASGDAALKKLTSIERNALRFLAKNGGWTPGDAAQAKGGPEVIRVLNRLAKLGRVAIEDTDDGPRFRLTVQGEIDAA